MHKALATLAWTTLIAYSLAALGDDAASSSLLAERNEPLTLHLYPTFGFDGPIRTVPYLPGERVFLDVEVLGVKASAKHRCKLKASVGLFDADGRQAAVIFDGDYERYLTFEGGYVSLAPLATRTPIPLDCKPGDYECRATVRDELSGKSATRSLPVKILPRGTFGAVDLQLAYYSDSEKDAPVTGTHAMAGRKMFLAFRIVGHAIVNRRLKAQVTLRVKTTAEEVLSAPSHTLDWQVASDDVAEPSQQALFGLLVTRPGQFVLEFECEDLLAESRPKKSYQLPLVAVGPWTNQDSTETKDQSLTVNIRPTFGPYGAARPATYLPRDRVYVSIQGSGVRIGWDGRADLHADVALFDQHDRLVETTIDGRCAAPLSFGGKTLCLPSAGSISALPADSLPGDYLCQATIRDAVDGRVAKASFPMKILPPGTFGAADLRLCYDVNGEGIVGTHARAGRDGYVFCQLVGQTVRDNRIKIRAKRTVRDTSQRVISTDQEAIEVPMDNPNRIELTPYHQYALTFNRPGSFVLEYELEDLLADHERKASYQIPITVVAPWSDGQNPETVVSRVPAD